MRLTEAFLNFVGFKPPTPLPEGAHRDGGHVLVTALVERNRQLQDELAVERQAVKLLIEDDEEMRTDRGS